MQSRVISRRIAAAAIFAALYAVLRLIPLSPLIGVKSSFTLGEIFSPLTGMLLGPVAGGLSVLIGTFLAAVLGRPLVFDGLDFIPGVSAAIAAGLAMTGRVRWAASFALALFVLFEIDPLSPRLVTVGSVLIPFLWMHVLALVAFVGVSASKNSSSTANAAFIVAVVWLSTMTAHVSGGIMFENVVVRINQSLSAQKIAGIWNVVFFVYPIERAFFTIVGAALAISVLRAIPKQTLDLLRGLTKVGPRTIPESQATA